VLVTGGEGERRLTAAVAAAGGVDLGGRTSFEELAALLGRAAVVATGNTGPAHLAAAVGTPVVSVFPPTVPATRWRPWGVEHVLLGAQEIECAGCRARTCPVFGQPCISSVSTAEATSAVEVLVPLTAPAVAAPVHSGVPACE
jgi:ADP-heptose:LPS heptosyltransferase